MYTIIYSSQAKKDSKKAASAGFKSAIVKLIEIIRVNPYQNPPPYEKLIGSLSGSLSRRINIQHRLVYHIYETEKVVKILRMWSHYE